MKSSKLIEIFKEGNIVVPMYLLKNYKEMKLELDEFVYLIYLFNQGDKFIFDPNMFANKLSMDLTDIMKLNSNLTDKGFINVEVVENDKCYMEEFVSLDNFYNKLKLFMVDDINSNETKKINDSTIYETIEKEFGRTLSSIEYEIIRGWLEHNYSEEIIKEALKEAVLNGVSNLKYMDKILYEWGKKGIKSVEDVEKNRKKRNNALNKEKETKSDIDLGIIDWDWFDED